jgi:hypothetical protein
MRYRLIGFLGATTLATTMATAGCGGSEGDNGAGGTGGAGGSGGASFTSLSGSAQLSSLAPADATKLCDDTYAHFRTAIPAATACKWKGLSFATSSSAPTEEQLKANCSVKENECLADPTTALATNRPCDFPTGCMATVAEYSTCVNDLVAAFNQIVGGLSSCSTLTKTGTDAVWEFTSGATPGASPASCKFPNCLGLYPPDPKEP